MCSDRSLGLCYPIRHRVVSYSDCCELFARKHTISKNPPKIAYLLEFMLRKHVRSIIQNCTIVTLPRPFLNIFFSDISKWRNYVERRVMKICKFYSRLFSFINLVECTPVDSVYRFAQDNSLANLCVYAVIP